MAAEGKQGPLNDLVVRFTGPGAADRVRALARRHAAAERRPDALAGRRQDLGVDLRPGRDRLPRHRGRGRPGDRAARRSARRAGEQATAARRSRAAAAPAVARAVDITINPNDAKQWAVGTEQGMFLSTNSGGSWRQRDTTFGARVVLGGAGRALQRRAGRQGAQERRRRQGVGRRSGRSAPGRRTSSPARTASSTPTSRAARSAAPRTAARPGPTSSACSDGRAPLHSERGVSSQRRPLRSSRRAHRAPPRGAPDAARG